MKSADFFCTTRPRAESKRKVLSATCRPLLYGQIKALRLELLTRYNVELSVHSALFTWLVRHAQWFVNRYPERARHDGF